jgi:hypothetical protein
VFRAPDVLPLLPIDRPQAAMDWRLVWSLPQERASGPDRAGRRGLEHELIWRRTVSPASCA